MLRPDPDPDQKKGAPFGALFFMPNNIAFFRFIDMRINSSTTSISFYPFISFEGLSTALVEVYHKPTKTMASGSQNLTITGSKVSIGLPSLSTITPKAKNLDEILIRIFDGSGHLIWEYLGMWIVGSDDLQRNWKSWNTTANQTKNWVTL